MDRVLQQGSSSSRQLLGSFNSAQIINGYSPLGVTENAVWDCMFLYGHQVTWPLERCAAISDDESSTSVMSVRIHSLDLSRALYIGQGLHGVRAQIIRDQHDASEPTSMTESAT